jgi:uncharacterized membrane protein YcaP (DUF421 family)
MERFFDLDWEHIFVSNTPLLEIVIRGTVMYLALFIMLRVILKRETGAVGITDLLLVVLLADAAQNALADDYRSLPDGILLVGTIIFWNYFLDWLGFRFPLIQRLIHPPALLLVQDGEIQRRNLRKELLTDDELRGMLREQGVEDLARVKKAYMEGNGKISVITDDDARHKLQNPPVV